MNFIQEPGECCGFSAWEENGTVYWENNICGRGIVNSGQFSHKLFLKLTANIDWNDLAFNEWNECIVPINNEVEMLIDGDEIEMGFRLFTLRKKSYD